MVAERILVVDDEEMNRDLLQRILDRAGYQVTTAVDGQEALTLLRQETFHVVLTDLKMPGMTGVEVIQELKTLAPFTMGIIHTAHSSIETAVEAMRAGAYDYVTKPVQRDELLVVIQRALEFQRLILPGKPDQPGRGLFRVRQHHQCPGLFHLRHRRSPGRRFPFLDERKSFASARIANPGFTLWTAQLLPSPVRRRAP